MILDLITFRIRINSKGGNDLAGLAISKSRQSSAVATVDQGGRASQFWFIQNTVFGIPYFSFGMFWILCEIGGYQLQHITVTQ